MLAGREVQRCGRESTQVAKHSKKRFLEVRIIRDRTQERQEYDLQDH